MGRGSRRRLDDAPHGVGGPLIPVGCRVVAHLLGGEQFADALLRQRLAKVENELEQRKVIDRAKRLLMDKRGMSENEAYAARDAGAPDGEIRELTVRTKFARMRAERGEARIEGAAAVIRLPG